MGHVFGQSIQFFGVVSKDTLDADWTIFCWLLDRWSLRHLCRRHSFLTRTWAQIWGGQGRTSDASIPSELELLRVLDLPRRGARRSALGATDGTHQQDVLSVTPAALADEASDEAVLWPNAREAGVPVVRRIGGADEVDPHHLRPVAQHTVQVAEAARRLVDLDAHLRDERVRRLPVAR